MPDSYQLSVGFVSQSARVVMNRSPRIRLGSNAHRSQSFRGLLQRFYLLAERESRDRTPQLRPRIETHPRHRRAPNLLRQPNSKLPRLETRDLREIREYIVGPLRRCVLESCLIESGTHDVPPS